MNGIRHAENIQMEHCKLIFLKVGDYDPNRVAARIISTLKLRLDIPEYESDKILTRSEFLVASLNILLPELTRLRFGKYKFDRCDLERLFLFVIFRFGCNVAA